MVIKVEILVENSRVKLGLAVETIANSLPARGWVHGRLHCGECHSIPQLILQRQLIAFQGFLDVRGPGWAQKYWMCSLDIDWLWLLAWRTRFWSWGWSWSWSCM